ncbi:hydrogenase maturation protease [Vulcanococcus limneticus]|uniref:hydrogenase maturation protease n=1 Tax=Vulcanococcus limneticus TaxID=2170428 RepID=UPI00398BD61E
MGAGRLVIGIGNSLRQDDGVGWRVAETLAARVAAGALVGLEALAVQQLTPELVEPIAAAGAVVLVDAVITAAAGSGPAGLEPLRLEPLHPANASTRTPLTHHATPAALLALTSTLHGTCPPSWQLLIPIAASTTGFGEELSPGASARLAEALDLLTAWARHA